tara:strand:+ start:174 stop:446 length:273 start_codon:yes stop_codon:yes gene_type:complete
MLSFDINHIEIIGLLAGTLTTISFLPQAYKTFSTKDVSSFSLTTFFIFFVGIFCWLIYGIYRQSLSMIIANSIMMVLTSVLLITIIKYRK